MPFAGMPWISALAEAWISCQMFQRTACCSSGRLWITTSERFQKRSSHSAWFSCIVRRPMRRTRFSVRAQRKASSSPRTWRDEW